MWNKIKDFIFEYDKEEVNQFLGVEETIEHIAQHQQLNAEITTLPSTPTFTLPDLKLLEMAKKHYCSKCNKWFKTAGATSAHLTLKHKNNE